MRPENGELEANYPCKLCVNMHQHVSTTWSCRNVVLPGRGIKITLSLQGNLSVQRSLGRTEVRSRTILPSPRVRGAGNG